MVSGTGALAITLCKRTFLSLELSLVHCVDYKIIIDEFT